jgi:iron complex outermembrane receptor protein
VEDYQANIVSSLETAAIRSYPSNVPEVRVQGFEADFVALLFDGFTLRFSAAYADGENTDYPMGPCPLELQTAATVACNLTGVAIAGLSKRSATLAFDYRKPLRGGELLIHLDTSSRAGYFSDASASRYTWIDGYSISNASAGYRFRQGWELGVYARNVFDEDYVTALTIQTGNSGLILGQPGEPRLLGITLRRAW